MASACAERAQTLPSKSDPTHDGDKRLGYTNHHTPSSGCVDDDYYYYYCSTATTTVVLPTVMKYIAHLPIKGVGIVA